MPVVAVGQEASDVVAVMWVEQRPEHSRRMVRTFQPMADAVAMALDWAYSLVAV